MHGSSFVGRNPEITNELQKVPRGDHVTSNRRWTPSVVHEILSQFLQPSLELIQASVLSLDITVEGQNYEENFSSGAVGIQQVNDQLRINLCCG
jgi:hypothetical protein